MLRMSYSIQHSRRPAHCHEGHHVNTHGRTSLLALRRGAAVYRVPVLCERLRSSHHPIPAHTRPEGTTWTGLSQGWHIYRQPFTLIFTPTCMSLDCGWKLEHLENPPETVRTWNWPELKKSLLLTASKVKYRKTFKPYQQTKQRWLNPQMPKNRKKRKAQRPEMAETKSEHWCGLGKM